MKLRRFSLKRYRAFDARTEIEFAPITVVIGSNHAGKTTLVRAPWVVTQPFAHGATVAFPRDPSGATGASVGRMARGQSGFEVSLEFDGGGDYWSAELLANEAVEATDNPILGHLKLIKNGTVHVDRVDVPWGEAGAAIRDAGIDGLHESVGLLSGIRAEAQDSYRIHGGLPEGVGFAGEEAPFALASFRDRNAFDAWCSEHMGVTYNVHRDLAWSSFRVTVNDGASEVLLTESGTGLTQVLPVAIALLLLPKLPTLYALEHPELHLHPHAHRAVAELLVAARKRHPSTSFLVETHSDTLVLRLRRAVVEGRLSPDDLRILYVSRGALGSEVRTIHINDRGVPDWWPKGVFAEAQAEFDAMRRTLNARSRP